MQSSSLRLVDVSTDQLDEVIDVRARSFGPIPAARREEWGRQAEAFIAARRFLGVVDGERIVAAARIWDLEQWWVGRKVPMGGVAGVVVAPEYRGRGVGTQLMRGVLERCHEFGFPISTLYPNLLPIYRKVGYEIAGARHRFTFPAWAVRAISSGTQSEAKPPVQVRRASAGDADLLFALVGRHHEQSAESGPFGWPFVEVQEWLARDDTFCYIADDGFVVYRWDHGDLTVDELVAGSESTARALWATVGSGASVAKNVRAYVAPHDPIHLLLGEEADHEAKVQRWMLRLVDAPAAMAARGWAASAEVDVSMEIVDDDLPANSGSWRLQVSGGTGRLTRQEGAEPALRVTARGLAGFYAGVPAASLRTASLINGGAPKEDAALDAASATSAPYALDFF